MFSRRKKASFVVSFFFSYLIRSPLNRASAQRNRTPAWFPPDLVNRVERQLNLHIIFGLQNAGEGGRLCFSSRELYQSGWYLWLPYLRGERYILLISASRGCLDLPKGTEENVMGIKGGTVGGGGEFRVWLSKKYQRLNGIKSLMRENIASEKILMVKSFNF